jgi:hypothetical protein
VFNRFSIPSLQCTEDLVFQEKEVLRQEAIGRVSLGLRRKCLAAKLWAVHGFLKRWKLVERYENEYS